MEKRIEEPIEVKMNKLTLFFTFFFFFPSCKLHFNLVLVSGLICPMDTCAGQGRGWSRKGISSDCLKSTCEINGLSVKRHVKKGNLPLLQSVQAHRSL